MHRDGLVSSIHLYHEVLFSTCFGNVQLLLWTHVNSVLSFLLQIDYVSHPGLCLLNDDSNCCMSSLKKRMLFTAAKKTIIQNWFTPHMCAKTHVQNVRSSADS